MFAAFSFANARRQKWTKSSLSTVSSFCSCRSCSRTSESTNSRNLGENWRRQRQASRTHSAATTRKSSKALEKYGSFSAAATRKRGLLAASGRTSNIRNHEHLERCRLPEDHVALKTASAIFRLHAAAAHPMLHLEKKLLKSARVAGAQLGCRLTRVNPCENINLHMT